MKNAYQDYIKTQDYQYVCKKTLEEGFTYQDFVLYNTPKIMKTFTI